jgi:hypothetical protein
MRRIPVLLVPHQAHGRLHKGDAMKPKGRQLIPRICQHCGADHGITGPRPFESVLALVKGEILFACSHRCAKALGWPVR